MCRRIRHLKAKSYGAAVCFDARTLALNDGDSVGTWTDSSYNSEDATASGTARPTFKKSILNGNPVVRFDGSNNKLNLSTTQFIKNTQTWSLLCVVKVESTAGTYPAIFSTKTDTIQNWRFIGSSSATYSDFSFGSNASTFGQYKFSASAYGTWHILSARRTSTGATSTARYAATSDGVTKTITTANAYGSETGSTGALGAESGGGNKFKGDIGFFTFISTNINDSLLKKINHSLAFIYKTSCS